MSTLSQIADDYLQLRHALGHKLDDAGRLLPRLVAYLEGTGAQTITLEVAPPPCLPLVRQVKTRKLASWRA